MNLYLAKMNLYLTKMNFYLAKMNFYLVEMNLYLAKMNFYLAEINFYLAEMTLATPLLGNFFWCCFLVLFFVISCIYSPFTNSGQVQSIPW